MKRIGVVIPSRLQRRGGADGSGQLFISSAIKSIRAQKAGPEALEFRIYVGIDSGTLIPGEFAHDRDVSFTESAGRSQASALNAAARMVDADYVAFLEDDDTWTPHFIEAALAALTACDFTSSTQLEFSPDGAVLRINDFPTPSGWLMTRATFEKVGLFTEEYRWHIDNEWLGRLAEADVSRAHLIEATAPLELRLASQIRPWLANCLRLGGPRIRLARHSHLRPLVNRLVHPGSCMVQIASDPKTRKESLAARKMLQERFGRMPW